MLVFYPLGKKLRKTSWGGGGGLQRKTFVANHSLALKIKELTSRKIVRGGHDYKSKLKEQRGPCTAALFPQNDEFMIGFKLNSFLQIRNCRSLFVRKQC